VASKVEGIYREKDRIGQELLYEDAVVKDKESFFSKLDEDTDFSIFLNHLNFVKEKELKGYSFINLKPSTLAKYGEDVMKVINSVKNSKIVLEIKEDYAERDDLRKIVLLREKYSFLLCLDDFGVGSSNLERVRLLKPNFVKIDLKLFETPKELSSFVRFLRSYSNSVLIAEKVESKEDYETIIKSGLNLWQGYYCQKLFS